MQAVRRAASLLSRAERSAPTTAGMQYPPPGVVQCVSVAKFVSTNRQSMTQDTPTETFVTVEEHRRALQELTESHEKALANLSTTMDERLVEEKHRFEEALILYKYELKKEASEMDLKCSVDHLNTMNAMKVAEEQFKSHKMEIEAKLAEGQLSRRNTIALGFVGLCPLVVIVSMLADLFPKW